MTTLNVDREPTIFEVETVSGEYVDVLEPRVETIRITDIAHHLSQICRFGGASLRPYSVAEHAVHVARKVIEEGRLDLALAALHHDDHEAYTTDITRPLKLLLDRLIGEHAETTWRSVTANLDRVIAHAIGVCSDQFKDPLVKAADDWMMMSEAVELVPSRGRRWHVKTRWPVAAHPAGRAFGWSPQAAATAWLNLHAQLRSHG